MTKLLQPFSRITTAGRTFLPQVDGLRFVAIMAVIAFHIRHIISAHYGVSLESPAGSGDVVNEFFAAGSNGVQLFFAVSGFILVLPFAKAHLKLGASVGLRAYFTRRLTRLEPPYLIHLFFLFLLCCTVYRHIPARPEYYHNPEWFAYTWHHLLASLFYANGFVYGTHPAPNIVLWSLEVEVQFYLLAPLLALIFKMTNVVARRTFIISLILLLPLFAPRFFPGYLLSCSLAGNLQFFLTGFLWCDLYLTAWHQNPAREWRWDLAWMVVLPLLVCHRHISHFGWLLPWLILVVGLAAFRGRFSGWFLGNPWIATIGGMCYTIYMYHWLMISALIRLTYDLHAHDFWLTLLIQFLVMVPIIIAACAVAFVLFERPFMRRDWPARLKAFFGHRQRP